MRGADGSVDNGGLMARVPGDAGVWVDPDVDTAHRRGVDGAGRSPVRAILRTIFDNLPLFGLTIDAVRDAIKGIWLVGPWLNETLATALSTAAWLGFIAVLYQLFVHSAWGRRDRLARQVLVRQTAMPVQPPPV